MGSRTAKATMTASGNILVVDADAFIAYVDEDDAHAEKTITILQACAELEMIPLYPATVIVEAVTTLQRRLRKPFLAQKIVDEVQAQQFIMLSKRLPYSSGLTAASTIPCSMPSWPLSPKKQTLVGYSLLMPGIKPKVSRWQATYFDGSPQPAQAAANNSDS
jgi:hypothetical protein